MEFKPPVNFFSAEYIIILLLLIVTFSLSFYFSWYKKKNSLGLLNKAKVLDKAYLDNKVKMYVVDYDSKKFIVVENGSAITISEQIKE
ncbi:hypothetical protein [Vibrio metschnikovii]|uniref:hypothetical protein n=1 Tax=Vibrio metschnikovii TaxID=28172 RepID=UPI001C30FB97|nr:hypothetical protein [Vibrio metschnikovii]